MSHSDSQTTQQNMVGAFLYCLAVAGIVTYGWIAIDWNSSVIKALTLGCVLAAWGLVGIACACIWRNPHD